MDLSLHFVKYPNDIKYAFGLDFQLSKEALQLDHELRLVHEVQRFGASISRQLHDNPPLIAGCTVTYPFQIDEKKPLWHEIYTPWEQIAIQPLCLCLNYYGRHGNNVTISKWTSQKTSSELPSDFEQISIEFCANFYQSTWNFVQTFTEKREISF